MKRVLSFVLPQAVLLPLGFVCGLLVGVVRASGGWVEALARMNRESGGVGPGHAGSGLLVVLAAAIAILGLAIASSITLAGLSAGLLGTLYGFVTSCLIDWLLLARRKISARDPEIVKRWAGRGALAVSALCAWMALFNPLREVAGVFAVTGTFACLGFGSLGVLRFAWARLK